jgi:hypothetical protein
MAMPIKPTPRLNEKQSTEFIRAIDRDKRTPSYPKANREKLEEARKKVYDLFGKKQTDR